MNPTVAKNSAPKRPGKAGELDLHLILERAPLPFAVDRLRASIAGKRVLVTGAGGSIGSSLARLLVEWEADAVTLVDNHEHSLYHLQGTLGRAVNLRYYLADIRTPNRIARIIAERRPEVVFHLAAYKHVPLGEENPSEVFTTNVIGTRNVLRAAADGGVRTLAFSSTDKAVYPPSVYGATKRAVELMLLAFGREQAQTRCGLVRLVNAVGAQGGVIRLFADQLLAGEALTVTDERMTRYWISIEEAALLVAQAACSVAEASLIVPDVGPPLPLTAIVERLHRLLCPETRYKVRVTGLRPGERLHELLLREDETAVDYGAPAVRAVSDLPAVHRPSFAEIATHVEELQRCVELGDDDSLRRHLFDLARR